MARELYNPSAALPRGTPLVGPTLQELGDRTCLQVRAAAINSDANVLVSFAVGWKTYGRFPELAELLEDVLGRPVELVTVESWSSHLRPQGLGPGAGCPSSRLITSGTSRVRSSTSCTRCAGVDESAFFADATLRRAFIRSLEVIGVAKERLPLEAERTPLRSDATRRHQDDDC
jgi:hypothetical protein